MILILPLVLGLAAVVVAVAVPPIRRALLLRPLMPVLRSFLPKLGDTERTALESGTVWFDGELFSGDPDWQGLLDSRFEDLTPREQAFLDGPVEELCEAVVSWDVQQAGELPDRAWALIRQHRFFGMVIPEAYGGLGFSAAAHSAVVARLSSRSAALAVTVMVPNSLGPAELLLRYGTDEQKTHWLPRLATGEEIPCFALTGPEAGSDAAATQSTGVVEYGPWKGKQVLGMRLDWDKRYTTLAPIATVFGLAFRLRDPQGLLGDTEELGITCALVPADLPGIERGSRHDPLGIPFQNGPSRGRGVFVPLDAIIGGREQAGNGWRMLMETLAAGRGISLPSLAVGSSQLALRTITAYGMVREQFDTPIGRFEGVEEPIARTAGRTWLMEAMRRMSVGAVDLGERPAVLSGIAKTYLTELMRDVMADAMDVRAGAAIVRGPRNILAMGHQAVPIGITVEGANILTRSLILYGQGAIRCHPYLLDEIRALEQGDVAAFDKVFGKHLVHPVSLAVRGFLLALTNGATAKRPDGTHRRDVGMLQRYSVAFALVSEAAVLSLGGGLKRRERITGRLADTLAWLSLGAAAVKTYHDHGCRSDDALMLRWTMQFVRERLETSLTGVLDNLPSRPLAAGLRLLLFPWGTRARTTDDALETEIARRVMDHAPTRNRMTSHVYLPPSDERGLGELEAALTKARAALRVEAKVRDAVRNHVIDKAPGAELADRALEAGVITLQERRLLHEADEAQALVVAVDAFEPEAYPAAAVG